MLPLRGEPRTHAIRDSKPRRALSFRMRSRSATAARRAGPRGLAAPPIGRSYRRAPKLAEQPKNRPCKRRKSRADYLGSPPCGGESKPGFPRPSWPSSARPQPCRRRVRPPSHRAASCSFSTGQHRLTITSSDLKVVLEVRREGQEIVVLQNGVRIGCGAAAPTVANVDTISVSARTEFRVDLRGGPLAPGFTDEGDGSSEIEIDADFGRAGGLPRDGLARKGQDRDGRPRRPARRQPQRPGAQARRRRVDRGRVPRALGHRRGRQRPDLRPRWSGLRRPAELADDDQRRRRPRPGQGVVQARPDRQRRRRRPDQPRQGNRPDQVAGRRRPPPAARRRAGLRPLRPGRGQGQGGSQGSRRPAATRAEAP